MKETAGGKQMKSVWEIRPPEREEKRFGKHPTQKPVALLKRALLASSNEGDLVLDPFLGTGTTAVASLRLSRFVIAVDSEASWIDLALARVCAELVFVSTSVACCEIELDLFPRSVDRSGSVDSPIMGPQSPGKLVRRKCFYYFVGAHHRDVVFSVAATAFEEAWQMFRSSPHRSTEILFIIRTETEIYLNQGK